jgi:pimeloyl-ACP methyl ester carboxylesterase
VAEPFRAMAGRIGVDGFLRQQTAIIGRPDSRPTLATIRCHTHIICGRDDLVTPVALHEEMRDGIAGANLTVLGNCGHLAPLERAEEVTNALRDFTERVPH